MPEPIRWQRNLVPQEAERARLECGSTDRLRSQMEPTRRLGGKNQARLREARLS
jgi:hypothetical protein